MTRKKRSAVFWLVTLLSIVVTVLFDPDLQLIRLPWGATAVTELGAFTRPITATLIAFGLLRLLFGYSVDEIEIWTQKAKESPTGAGMIAIATAIFFLGLSAIFSTAKANDLGIVVPKNAPTIIAAFKDQQPVIWPDMQLKHLAMAQLEHESCVSLYSLRCMSYTSQLKATRPNGDKEEGAGVVMGTRVVSATGVVKMDSVTSMKKRYPYELASLSWDNIYINPKGQMAFYLLLSRDNERMFATVSDVAERRNFALASYNSGPGSVKTRRQICGLKAGCNPQKWEGNASTTCPLSNKPIYGKRSACDINNGYVADVLARGPKYVKFF